MAEVGPIRAIRYDFRALRGDLSDRLAPPYDVLDQADKDALLARSDRNIVRIDLPHIPPGFEGPAERYAEAAQTLDAWLADGTLIRESAPALYVYHQEFDYAGRKYCRKKFFAAVRLRPFDDRVVLPHEHTFGGPKADRLALMKATRCALSPVFGCYEDPDHRIDAILHDALKRDPDAVGTMDGVINRVWIVSDEATTRAVMTFLAEKPIYIADGHHRYGTALNYKAELEKSAGAPLAADHPANFALFVLASMDDPGCLVLPTHRVFKDDNLTMDVLLDAWSGAVEVCDSADGDVMVFDGRTGNEKHLKFTQRDRLKTFEPDRSDAWAKLDLAYVHRLLIDERLTNGLLNGHEPKLAYAKSDAQARRMATEGPATVVFVKATTMAELRAVCEAGDLMPQKSTFFYPKLATGIAIKPLSTRD